MIILRNNFQKEFAAKDYKNLSYFGIRYLRKSRNKLAKRLRKDRKAINNIYEDSNKFDRKFMEDMGYPNVDIIGDYPRQLNQDALRRRFNYLKGIARNKAEDLTKRDIEVSNSIGKIAIPIITIGGTGSIASDYIVNSDDESL